ncbi:hypothetical protein HMI54_013510, partial [Coelomomyces lativittatus]
MPWDLSGQTKYWVYLDKKSKRLTQEPHVSKRTLINRKLVGLELYQYSDLPLDD